MVAVFPTEIWLTILWRTHLCEVQHLPNKSRVFNPSAEPGRWWELGWFNTGAPWHLGGIFLLLSISTLLSHWNYRIRSPSSWTGVSFKPDKLPWTRRGWIFYFKPKATFIRQANIKNEHEHVAPSRPRDQIARACRQYEPTSRQANSEWDKQSSWACTCNQRSAILYLGSGHTEIGTDRALERFSHLRSCIELPPPAVSTNVTHLLLSRCYDILYINYVLKLGTKNMTIKLAMNSAIQRISFQTVTGTSQGMFPAHGRCAYLFCISTIYSIEGHLLYQTFEKAQFEFRKAWVWIAPFDLEQLLASFLKCKISGDGKITAQNLVPVSSKLDLTYRAQSKHSRSFLPPPRIGLFPRPELVRPTSRSIFLYYSSSSLRLNLPQPWPNILLRPELALSDPLGV